jgi:hypothetical protein
MKKQLAEGKITAEDLAKTCLEKAQEGDHRFMSLIADRIDGKALERVATDLRIEVVYERTPLESDSHPAIAGEEDE